MNKNDFNNDDYRNPKFWKWGVFYFNKDDVRLFIPKRNPFFGWTINFASPLSILFFILLMVLIGLLSNRGK
ncbi:hypothetical protein A9P82_11500 [Arachidicoccus ginsenosidimutans]|uniref:DUF5808 domain-containing protein n=1 Tax=Arachidicoccus sp. BS20 TaxID=1850526 RepID=UPI0007F1848C|nr:hypothetical protein A9P82_11500 [Arachidicoccus sp. BS20]